MVTIRQSESSSWSWTQTRILYMFWREAFSGCVSTTSLALLTETKGKA